MEIPLNFRNRLRINYYYSLFNFNALLSYNEVTPAILAEHIDLAALPPESHKLLLLPLDANFN